MLDQPLGNHLSEADLRMFRRLGVSPELLDHAQVVRVTDGEARGRGFSFSPSGDLAGLVFPYFDRETLRQVTSRLRRDNPETENGRPKNKYLCPYGDRRHLYFVPGTKLDGDHTIVLVEAEKSALAVCGWAERSGVNIVPVGMGGCWGWRARIGKSETSNGRRVDEVGPLPDLNLCRGRQIVVMLDSNASTKPDVRRAERELVAVLIAMDARVKIVRVPNAAGINGPDDLLAVRGDDALRLVLDAAKPSEDTAITDAEELTCSLKNNKGDIERIREAIDAIGAVSDRLKQEYLYGELSKVMKGTISKETIKNEVRYNVNRREEKAEERKREMEKLDLETKPVNKAKLLLRLEKFFSDRAYLPNGAALLLAFFALLTYIFDLFDAVPYISLESAVAGCGKTTVMRLLEVICARAVMTANESVAVLFRAIDKDKPTLLIDEAKGLEAKTDKAEELRGILQAGYKRGGKVRRCEGEENGIREFDVFCPKVIAEIGSLSGALLDRCIPIHMEKAPKGHKRKSTRVRALRRDAAQLVAEMKAYALQAMVGLGKLYADEPDEGYWNFIRDREAELYGPLLIQARWIGSHAERKLVKVVKQFTKAKTDIQSEDWGTAKAIAILEVLREIKNVATFMPGDLVEPLSESEAWSSVFGKVGGADQGARHKAMATKVARFLRSFRLESVKHTKAGNTYDREKAIQVFSRHLPENDSLDSPDSQPADSPMHVVENEEQGESVNRVNHFSEVSHKGDSGPTNDSSGRTKFSPIDDDDEFCSGRIQ